MQIVSSETTETTEINISSLVEEHILKNGGSYIDAVIEICESEELDPIIVGKDLSKPIKEKIEMEGISRNMLPRKTDGILPV